MREEDEKSILEKSEEIEEKIVKSEKSVKAYQYFVIRLLVLLLAIWVVFFKVIGFMHMPSEDMKPNINANDLILFYRLDKNVRAQDVIVVEKKTPDSGNENNVYVLRVVAKEGDTVEVTEDRLLINGNAVIESNIYYDTWYYEGFQNYPVTLGKDECFVLADMREGGEDSRYFGVVNKSEIVGTVITIMRRQGI